MSDNNQHDDTIEEFSAEELLDLEDEILGDTAGGTAEPMTSPNFGCING